MADIFISYARNDRAKIEMLATALKAEGYSVWWDRDIHGGENFSAEINRQLAAAEIVVVAWSEQSICSEWVLDEAAQARDDGKLIPISLNNIVPPLGFRQRQSVDFSKWRGAANAEEFIELKNSVARIKGGGVGANTMHPHLGKASRSHPTSIILGSIAAGVALIAAIGFFALRGGGPEQADQTKPMETKTAQAPQYIRSAFAFAPIETYDESQEGARFARSLANEMERTLVTNLLTVVDVNEESNDTPRAEFLVEMSVDRDSENFLVDVEVTHSPSDTKAWSYKHERSVEEANHFREQIANTVTKSLRCAMDDFRKRTEGTDDPKIINVVMRLCEAMRTEGPLWRQMPTISREFLALAPNSGLAHASLASNLAFSTWWGRAPEELEKIQAEIREHAERALELQPGIGEAYHAIGFLVDPDVSLIEREQLARKALADDPDFYLGRAWLGNFLAGVGRWEEARSHLRQHIDKYPLDGLRPGDHAEAVSAMGNIEYATSLFRDTAERFPDGRQAIINWLEFEFWFGNSEIVKELIAKMGWEELAVICFNPVLDAHVTGETMSIEKLEELCGAENLEAWPGFPPNLYAQFGHLDEAFASLEKERADLKAPHNMYGRKRTIFRLEAAPLRADPRFMNFAAEIGLVDYWIEVGKWPDFCETEAITYDCAETARIALVKLRGETELSAPD